MTQLPLLGERGLEPAQQQVARQVTEQRRQLKRVAAGLGPVILAICEARLRSGRVVFHMEELVADVRKRRPAKESSVDRIFRVLRQDGALSYELLDRGASMYRLLPITPTQETP